MNERFKELMIKAIYDVDRIYDPIDNPLNEEVSKMYIPDCFAEKFAELIVKECASKVDWILAEGGKTQGDLIRQYFGVEK